MAIAPAIRPYQPADLPQLLEAFRQNTPTFFDPAEEADLVQYLQHQAHTYYVLTLAGQVVGGVGCQVTDGGRIGRVTWIFFAPAHSGQGLGSLAMRHCLQQLAHTPGLQQLAVTTSQHAHAFFARFGFTLVRTQNDYWGPGLHLYEMHAPPPQPYKKSQHGAGFICLFD